GRPRPQRGRGGYRAELGCGATDHVLFERELRFQLLGDRHHELEEVIFEKRVDRTREAREQLRRVAGDRAPFPMAHVEELQLARMALVPAKLLRDRVDERVPASREVALRKPTLPEKMPKPLPQLAEASFARDEIREVAIATLAKQRHLLRAHEGLLHEHVSD